MAEVVKASTDDTESSDDADDDDDESTTGFLSIAIPSGEGFLSSSVGLSFWLTSTWIVFVCGISKACSLGCFSMGDSFDMSSFGGSVVHSWGSFESFS